MNKILILGSTGMLGSTFRKYFRVRDNCKASYLNRSDVDLSRCSFDELSKKVEQKIRDEGCKYVINCAGVIKQGGFSIPDMIKVNSVIPHWLSEICEKLGVDLIHITTDCVYDGKKGNYSEEDPPTATDVYGISKSLGEPDNCTVIRTSIIGEEERGFKSLLEWIRSNKGKQINGFENHTWNGVTCWELARIVDRIIRGGLFWRGVRIFHSNPVNKLDLAEMINEIYDLKIDITPKNTPEACDRSLSTIHDISGYEITDLYDQIKWARDFYRSFDEY